MPGTRELVRVQPASLTHILDVRKKVNEHMPKRYDDFERVACPCCTATYVGTTNPFTDHGCDNYQSRSGLRGDCLVIPFEGECGSKFEIWFAFHKGETFTRYEVIEPCS